MAISHGHHKCMRYDREKDLLRLTETVSTSTTEFGQFERVLCCWKYWREMAIGLKDARLYNDMSASDYLQCFLLLQTSLKIANYVRFSERGGQSYTEGNLWKTDSHSTSQGYLFIYIYLYTYLLSGYLILIAFTGRLLTELKIENIVKQVIVPQSDAIFRQLLG